MQIDEVFNERLIDLDLQATTKDEAIQKLVSVLYHQGIIRDEDIFLQSVLEREKISSTYCGVDLAIPHGISDVVRRPAVCFARAEEFYWDDSQQDPVSFVVMLAIPKDKRAQGAHIEMLSAISLLFLEDDLRALWKETDSPQVVYESIVEALKKQAQ